MIISVRELEEFFFCPRMFYLHVVKGIEVPKGFWCDIGRLEQERVREKIKSMFKNVEEEVYIESKELCLCGKIDLVVDEVVPLEVKFSRSVKPWWRYSLVAYSLLLEDTVGKPVKRALLLLTPRDKIVEIAIYEEDREVVLRAIKECIEILEKEKEVKGKEWNCRRCDFRRYCYG